MFSFFKKRSTHKESMPLQPSTPVDGKKSLRQIGPYRLKEKLGKGGMAEVWVGSRGSSDDIHKTVAIKLLDPNFVSDEQYQKMFYEEAKLSMKLTHSNIAQVFDVGREGNQSYLVMEWVDGTNLANLCQLLYSHGLRLELDIIGYVIGEVLRALMYAHQVTDRDAPMGIVHRDVSPQNVLISVSGEVKLTDFGIARVASNETSGHLIRGKVRYMSPEQMNGNSKAPTVDLYAVGAMLHELLDAGKFRGDIDSRALYSQALAGVIPSLKAPQQVPPELNQLRLALLAADARQRVQSAQEAFAMLRKWPGYSNASPELAELCCICTGVPAPRSTMKTSHEGAPNLSEMSPEQQKAYRIHDGLTEYAEKLKWRKLKEARSEESRSTRRDPAPEKPYEQVFATSAATLSASTDLTSAVTEVFQRASAGSMVFTPASQSSQVDHAKSSRSSPSRRTLPIPVYKVAQKVKQAQAGLPSKASEPAKPSAPTDVTAMITDFLQQHAPPGERGASPASSSPVEAWLASERLPRERQAMQAKVKKQAKVYHSPIPTRTMTPRPQQRQAEQKSKDSGKSLRSTKNSKYAIYVRLLEIILILAVCWFMYIIFRKIFS